MKTYDFRVRVYALNNNGYTFNNEFLCEHYGISRASGVFNDYVSVKKDYYGKAVPTMVVDERLDYEDDKIVSVEIVKMKINLENKNNKTLC